MSDKLNFTFTNAITVNRPQRRTSRSALWMFIAAALLVAVAGVAQIRWDPAGKLLSEPPQEEINPLYDEH